MIPINSLGFAGRLPARGSTKSENNSIRNVIFSQDWQAHTGNIRFSEYARRSHFNPSGILLFIKADKLVSDMTYKTNAGRRLVETDIYTHWMIAPLTATTSRNTS